MSKPPRKRKLWPLEPRRQFPTVVDQIAVNVTQVMAGRAERYPPQPRPPGGPSQACATCPYRPASRGSEP